MIYEELKKAKITAMKNKDQVTKDILILILDNAEKLAKKSMREVSEADVISALRSTKNKAQEALDIYAKATTSDVSVEIARAQKEMEIATQFLPKETSESDVKAKILEIVASKQLPKAPSSMKILMGSLKEAFGANLNGNMARVLVETYLKS